MAIELIKEHVNEHMCKLDNYFNNIFKDFGRFYINPEIYNIDGLYSLDISFNELGGPGIYYSKITLSDTEFLYFIGLDSDDVIKNNKLINFDDFIYPNFSIKLNFNYNESGIVFGSEDGQLVLLMHIDFDSLNRDEISRLNEKSNIEEIDNSFFINFGSFEEESDYSLLRNIRNFISNVKIRKNNFSSIDLTTVRLPRSDLPKENIDFEFNTEKYNYCMICGEKIDETYDFNPQMRDVVGKNPNKCASCYAKILMSYFYYVMEGKSINRTYLLSLSRTPNLIKFYLDLLATNGIINRTKTIEFKEDLSNEYYQSFFDEIPEEYKIAYFKNDPVKKHSELFDKIDEMTLNMYDSLNTDFQKTLLESGLSLEDGWKIREELIQLVKEGQLKKNTLKAVNKAIKKLINNHISSPPNKSKSPIKKIKSLKLFNQAQELNELTLNKNLSFKNEFLNKLSDNGLSIDYAFRIRNQLIDEIEQGKIETSVEDRLIKLIKEITNPISTVEDSSSDVVVNENDDSGSEKIRTEPGNTEETSDIPITSHVFKDDELLIDIQKEYILIEDLIYLKTIILNSDIGNVLKSIALFKEIINCRIENIRIFELNEEYLNVFVEICFFENDEEDSIIKWLKKNDFRESKLI